MADGILASDGGTYVDQVDAMDEKAIATHPDKVVQMVGTVDISLNVTGVDVVQSVPLVEMAAGDFMYPITAMLQTRFLTAVAAGKVMIRHKSGVILSLTATPGGIGYPYTGGFAPACCAIESFSRNLASELGVYGVRVVNIRSAGSPDSRIFKEAMDGAPEIMEPVLQKMKEDPMLKQLPLMEDIANIALFLFSDVAAKITGVTIDVTCGTTAALNYRAVPATERPSVGSPLTQ